MVTLYLRETENGIDPEKSVTIVVILPEKGVSPGITLQSDETSFADESQSNFASLHSDTHEFAAQLLDGIHQRTAWRSHRTNISRVLHE